jgi:hypothetical protein
MIRLSILVALVGRAFDETPPADLGLLSPINNRHLLHVFSMGYPVDLTAILTMKPGMGAKVNPYA